MTPIIRKRQQLLLLEPKKALLLGELAAETRIPKQVLLREAVDDLLAKHGKLRSESWEDLRTVLRDSHALADTEALLGHDDRTKQQAARVRQVIQSVRDLFDKGWRTR